MSLNDYYSQECLWDDPCDDCSHWFGYSVHTGLLDLSQDVWDSWMYYH